MAGDSSLLINGPSTTRGALVLLVVGLAAAGFGGYDYLQQSEAVDDAVTVDAEVIETGVETVSGGRRGGVEYRPTVQFTYDGESYTSTNVFPSVASPNYDTESAARDALDGAQAGDTVTAYVDPADPDGAFLLNQTSFAPLLFVLIGALFVVGGGRTVVQNTCGG